MLLNELLNKKVDYEVLKAGKYQFITQAKIGDREIRFEASNEDDDEWGVAFEEIRSNENGTVKRTFNASGSRHELEVFAMVKDSMLEFVQRYQPLEITFTADKDGGKKDKMARANVYAKLFDRFKIPGYTMGKEDQKHLGYFFRLSRDRE